jgi:hypothetical protein
VEIEPYESNNPYLKSVKYGPIIYRNKLPVFDKAVIDQVPNHENAYFYYLKSRREVIAESPESLYLLKKKKFVELPRLPGLFSTPLYFHEISSINKVLLISLHGNLYEFTKNHQFKPISLDGSSPMKVIAFVEMPASRVVVIFSDNGVYALDKNGIPKLIENGNVKPTYDSYPFEKTKLLNSNEVIFVGDNALRLVIDKRTASAGECGS